MVLTYNRFFPRGDEAAQNNWHSRAHALRPDITLEYRGNLLILDAKFKTYQQAGWEGSDIEQMHAYRDAIAHGASRNVVRAAWLLYAGASDGASRRPVIAYPGATPTAPLGNGEVGAICLRPNALAPCNALLVLIREFLERF